MKNYFCVDKWEVSFLQEDVITVCVIRHLKNINKRFVGLAVCNPRDRFNPAIGRHKALKNCVDEVADFTIFFDAKNKNTVMSKSAIPVKAIQKEYWKHYGAEEKGQ